MEVIKEVAESTEKEKFLLLLKQMTARDSFTFQNNIFELNITLGNKNEFLTRVSFNNKKIIPNNTGYTISNLLPITKELEVKSLEQIANKKWLSKFSNANLAANYALLSINDAVDVLITFGKLSKLIAFE